MFTYVMPQMTNMKQIASAYKQPIMESINSTRSEDYHKEAVKCLVKKPLNTEPTSKKCL